MIFISILHQECISNTTTLTKSDCTSQFVKFDNKVGGRVFVKEHRDPCGCQWTINELAGQESL